MANYPGAKAYPLLTNPTLMLDVGSLTMVREVTISRGIGVKAYPLLANRTLMVDDGTLTMVREVTIPRGGTDEDYNVTPRGAGVRIDRKPKRPYP